MKRIVSAFAIAALATGIAGDAQALPATQNIRVSAVVVPACEFTAGDFAVGNYDATLGLTNTHDIEFRCTNGTDFNLTLSGITGTLKDGGGIGPNSLSYTLYKPDNSVWANNGTVGVTGTGALQTVAVRADIAANQFVPVGTYEATIVATLDL